MCIRQSSLYFFQKSVSAFGMIYIVENEDERLNAATLLGERFNLGDADGLKGMDKFFSCMLVLRMDIKDLTGKKAIELMRGRNVIGE